MRFKSLIAMTGVVAAAALLALPAQAQTKPAAKQQMAPVCANCHEAQWNSIDLTAHGAKNDPTGGMCQSCHGDATAHIKDPKVKPADPFGKSGTAETRTAVCMTCHSGNRNLAFWTSGKHQLNEVTCSNCHSIHGTKLAPSINKFVTTFLPNQADGCGTCHQPIRAATMKPSHHPIPEGKVKCSDCHNPHGAITPAMLKQPTINDQCYSCHADKRGPYLWEHAPSREGCVTCHDPHGSSNDRMLVAKQPALCQRCHAPSGHPGSVYDNTQVATSVRIFARGCVQCHSTIHGSNHPAGNRFIR